MLFIFCILLIAFISSLFVYVIVISPFILLLPHKKDLKYFKRKNIITDPDLIGIRYENINFRTFDGYMLKGWFLKAANPKATIIFLHGIGDSRYTHLEFLSKFVYNNYNVIMYDARAHGESEGCFCSYGFFEKIDVRSAIQFIDSCGITDEKSILGLMGVSLGGAVALQALNQDKRIKFCITESAFSNFRSTLNDYRSKGIFLVTNICNNIVDRRIERIGKFKINDIVPENDLHDYLGKVLLAHGDKDTKINIKYHNDLVKNAMNCESLIVKNADHNDIRSLGGEAFLKNLIEFADNIINENR